MVSIVFRTELTAVAEPAACHSPKREARGLANLMAPVRFADTALHGRVDIEHSPRSTDLSIPAMLLTIGAK
jgi:hypothetical protein